MLVTLLFTLSFESSIMSELLGTLGFDHVRDICLFFEILPVFSKRVKSLIEEILEGCPARVRKYQQVYPWKNQSLVATCGMTVNMLALLDGRFVVRNVDFASVQNSRISTYIAVIASAKRSWHAKSLA